jgi:hypothetical protein
MNRITSWLGAIGLLGCLAAAGTDVAGFSISGAYSPVSQTISNLAAGRLGWIQDAGLYLYAVGCIACAGGLLLVLPKQFRWGMSTALLFLFGVDIIILTSFHHYFYVPGETPLHISTSAFLAVAFAVFTWGIAPALAPAGKAWPIFSRAVCILWIISAPFFEVVSSEWVGLYERYLGAILLIWVGCLAWTMLFRPQPAIDG